MIEQQNRSVPKEGDPVQADIRKGAELPPLILAYEDAVHKGSSRNEAAHLLARLNPKFSPEFFAALVSLEPSAEGDEVRYCRIEELSPGMIIQQELRAHDGTRIISKGQEVTTTAIFRLENLLSRCAIPASIKISTPRLHRPVAERHPCFPAPSKYENGKCLSDPRPRPAAYDKASRTRIESSHGETSTSSSATSQSQAGHEGSAARGMSAR
jgi:hypothetical protein